MEIKNRKRRLKNRKMSLGEKIPAFLAITAKKAVLNLNLNYEKLQREFSIFFFFLTIGFFEKLAHFSIFEIKIVCYEKF